MESLRSPAALENSARRTNHMVILHKYVFHGMLVLAVFAAILLILVSLTFATPIHD